MNEKLKAYFDKMENEKQQDEQRDREAVLISQGLYETVYSDSPQTGYQYDRKSKKYFKLIPIEVSDAEYERILEYIPESVEPLKPTIWLTVLRIFGWTVMATVLVYGVIFAIRYALAGRVDFALLTAFGAIVVALLSASGIMAFVEMAQNVADIEQLIIYKIFGRK